MLFLLLLLVVCVSGWSPKAEVTGLRQLLLQRSLQTQLIYLTDFHDELRAEWLSEFGDPCFPLGTVRVSMKESLPKFHGLDALTEWHAKNYLEKLLRAEPVEYKVRYAVGTTPMVASPEIENAEVAEAAMSMWGAQNAGAASRRRNPYLESSKKYVEYDEILEPAKIAQQVMQTRQQLAKEWSLDLLKIPQIQDESDYERLTRNAPVTATFEDDVSSPLRGANLDLCDRLATRFAAYDLLEDLRSNNRPEEAHLLEQHLELSSSEETSSQRRREEDEDLDDPKKKEDRALAASLAAAACRVVTVDALGGHARRRGLAFRWLSKAPTPNIRKNITSRRDNILQTWVHELHDNVQIEHANLLRDHLKFQFQQNIGSSGGESTS